MFIYRSFGELRSGLVSTLISLYDALRYDTIRYDTVEYTSNEKLPGKPEPVRFVTCRYPAHEPNDRSVTMYGKISHEGLHFAAS